MLKLLIIIASFLWLEFMIWRGIFIHDENLAQNKRGAFYQYFLNNFIIGVPVGILVITLLSLGLNAKNVTMIMGGIAISSSIIMFILSEKIKHNKKNNNPKSQE